MLEGKGKCSYCSGVISPHATICRHCGKYIRPVTTRKLAQHRKHRSFGSAFINMGIGTITILFLSAVALMAIPAFNTQASGVITPNTAALASASRNVSIGSPVVFKTSAALVASGGSGGIDVYEPPVVNQGGNCIKGSIIDLYDMPIGAGWTINVYKSTDLLTVFDTLNAEASPVGTFYFPSIQYSNANGPYPAGTYVLTLVLPAAAYQQFTPISFSVTLDGSEDHCAVVRFKLEALAKLCVTKLDDGVVPPVGIAGWKFTVTNTATGKEWAGETDGTGMICFPDLPPGPYKVDEESKVGWQPSSSNPVNLVLASPTIPGTVTDLVFTNRQVHDGKICVKKTDVSGNLLDGWEITLTNPYHQVAPQKTGQTDDGKGITCFKNLALGDWIATETLQTWWQVAATSSNPQTVHLNTPGTTQTITFVNEPLGCVDGTKINDLDQPLAGWYIHAQRDSGGPVLDYGPTILPGGFFQFNLPFGTWKIWEDVQNGWTPITPASFMVTVTQQGPNCEHVRFKNATKYACVDVYKRDAFDGVGLPDWTISLAPAYFPFTPVLTGVTDGSGHYRFNGLQPGDYTIWETLKFGWTYAWPLTPNPGVYDKVTLNATGTCEVVEFYNSQTHETPPPAAETPECSSYYNVLPGDTLSSIASDFGVTWSALREINELVDPTQLPTVLCIP